MWGSNESESKAKSVGVKRERGQGGMIPVWGFHPAHTLAIWRQ